MIHADIQVTCSIGSDSKLGLNLTFDSFTISMVILLHAFLLKAYSVPWNCNIYPKYIDGIEVVGVYLICTIMLKQPFLFLIDTYIHNPLLEFLVTCFSAQNN